MKSWTMNCKWRTEGLMCSDCYSWEVCPAVTLIRRFWLYWSHQLFISLALVWGPELWALHLLLAELTGSNNWRREWSRSCACCTPEQYPLALGCLCGVMNALGWGLVSLSGSLVGITNPCHFSFYWSLQSFIIVYFPSLISCPTFFLGGGSV